jgi:hypothetical protein
MLRQDAKPLDLQPPSAKQSRRVSALHGIRKFFSDPQADQFANEDSPGKGSRHQPPLRRPTDEDYVVVSAESAQSSPIRESARDSLTTSRSFGSFESSRTLVGSTQPAAPRTTDTPVGWATASVPINLGKSHSPILFFKVARAPPDPTPTSRASAPPAPSHLRSSSTGSAETNRLYLIIATKASLHVFESEERSWHLVVDLYVPSQPRAVDLVRITPHNRARSSSTHDRTASTGKGRHSRRLSAESAGLGVFVSLNKDRAVVISLSDSSVREVDTPLLPQHVGDGKRSARSRAAQRASMIGYSQGLSDELVGGSFGNRGTSSADSDSIHSIESSKENQRDGWNHFFEFILGHRSAGPGMPLSLLFATKDRLTHVILPPLGGAHAKDGVPHGPDSAHHLNRSSSLSGGAGGYLPRLQPRPVHTFTWLSAPNRVVALVPPTPRGRNEGDDHYSTFPIVLAAFSATGVEVQEGHINLAALRSAPQQQQQQQRLGVVTTTPSSPVSVPFFVPLDRGPDSATLPPSPATASQGSCTTSEQDEIEEREGKASYDYGECRVLNPGRPSNVWLCRCSDWISLHGGTLLEYADGTGGRWGRRRRLGQCGESTGRREEERRR